MVANVTWSSQGIKDTIQNAIPLVGAFVTGVTTNPSAGTIELQGALGSITAKPAVVDNGISLQVTELTGLGFTLPRETVQPALDAFTSQLTKNYPLGIHADSVQVTDSGVVSQFSTQNASIPKGNEDPCFAGLWNFRRARRAPRGCRIVRAGWRRRRASRSHRRRCGCRRWP